MVVYFEMSLAVNSLFPTSFCWSLPLMLPLLFIPTTFFFFLIVLCNLCHFSALSFWFLSVPYSEHLSCTTWATAGARWVLWKFSCFIPAVFFDAAHSQNFWSFLYSWENFHCSVERCLWEVYDIFQALQNVAVNHGHTNLLEPQLLYYRKQIFEISFKVSPNYPSLHISKYLSSFCLLSF